MSALATNSTSASVPSYLKALIAHKMNRLFVCKYPSFGFIRSMLAAKKRGPAPLVPILNGIPDNSQQPVHRFLAHASVRSKGNFLSVALRFAESRGPFHG